MGVESVLVLSHAVRVAARLQLHPGQQQWYVSLSINMNLDSVGADNASFQLPIRSLSKWPCRTQVPA
jgi:hypothetical protein